MSSSLSDDDVQIIEYEQDEVQLLQPSAVYGFFTFKAMDSNGVEGTELTNNCSPNGSGKSVCNVIGCGSSIEGTNVKDLIKHLKMDHTFKEYKQFLYMSGKRGTHTRSLAEVKKNQTLIHSFFKFNAKSRISQCNVSGCKALIYGTHLQCFAKHLKRDHPKEYLAILNRKKESQLPSNVIAAKIQKLRNFSFKKYQPAPSVISNGVITLSAEAFSFENDLPESAQEQQSSDEKLLKAMTDIVNIIEMESTFPRSNVILSEIPPLIPIQEDEMILQHYLKNEDNLFETKVVLSPEANFLLNEQIQKHVQLLTQTHLILSQQSCLTPFGGALLRKECRSMLQDLVPLDQRMGIGNLKEALDLVTCWETVVSKTQHCEFQKSIGITDSNETQQPCPLNLELVKMMGESHVFMYPKLLPDLTFHLSKTEIGLFSQYEDQLIAMGLEQFTPFCVNLSIDSFYSLEYLVSSMISAQMLPRCTAEEIQMRIKKSCLDTSPENPIKYYMKNEMAPPIEHVISPFHSASKLRNVPLSLLQDSWRELFPSSTLTVPSSQQLPAKQLVCISSTDHSLPLVKVLPLRIVKSWSSRCFPHKVFPSQIPSLPKLSTLPDILYKNPLTPIPLYQQRHKPFCVNSTDRRGFLD